MHLWERKIELVIFIGFVCFNRQRQRIMSKKIRMFSVNSLPVPFQQQILPTRSSLRLTFTVLLL